MNLKELEVGDRAVITKVKGRGAFRKRIMEMGFVAGQSVESIKKAPMSDPVEYRIMGYDVSLRNSEAELIEIINGTQARLVEPEKFNGVTDMAELQKTADTHSKTINIALVGNPNCGKTTIFNFASGSQERVGNYCGVTVDAKTATFRLDGYTFNIVDLPGTYSISAYSPEELYVRDYILTNIPDVVVNVIDSSNLQRNLYLTTQLIDMDIKVVAALNMFDELEEKGDAFDHILFGKMTGIPFVPTIGSKGKGIKEMFRKIIDVFEDKDPEQRHVHINYGTALERSVKKLQDTVWQSCSKSLLDRVSSRFIAIKLLEKDKAIDDLICNCTGYKAVSEMTKQEIRAIEEGFKDDSEAIMTDQRYGFIQGALRETYKENIVVKDKKSDKIDRILTHKYLGIPIFLGFMWMSFYFTFELGSYPMGWLVSLVDFISVNLRLALPDGILRDFLADGVIGGMGGVVVFLPNIVLLYFFISLMEDTGYLSRAVFIMDKAMHRIGLHGKSFIPLLMGFGCNVPAILSSRIIESRRDRMITILINPFMSCSARLTVYVLMISAFFVSYQSLVLFSLYLIGILLAIASAWLFRKTLFKVQEIPFVMELPPYRFPTWRTIIKHMWFRASQYLKKVGGVILVASVIIWTLGYFPRNVEYSKDYSAAENTARKKYASEVLTEQNLLKIRQYEENLKIALEDINLEKESEHQEKSFIGMIGNLFQPVMSPLGFDWKMTVALIAGVSAKEVVVGTMGVLFQADNADGENQSSLISKLQEQRYKSGPKEGQLVFSPLVAYSFMLFILIYFPCISVIAAIRKESGSWKWAMFSVGYTTFLAWFISFIVFQVGSLLISI
jgi:ferrous iron transport protein B